MQGFDSGKIVKEAYSRYNVSLGVGLSEVAGKVWGWHTISWTVSVCLVPLVALLMVHHPHVHQPWRLDRCTLLNVFRFKV